MTVSASFVSFSLSTFPGDRARRVNHLVLSSPSPLSSLIVLLITRKKEEEIVEGRAGSRVKQA